VREVLEGRARYFDGKMPPFYDRMATLSNVAPFSVEMEYDSKLGDAVRAWATWRRAAGEAERYPANASFRRSLDYCGSALRRR
jgi:hypothetical protein